MALTHDGIQTPLPPNLQSLGLGLALLVGGIGAFFTPLGFCAAIPLIIIGLLMVVNQVSGKSRTRVTFSKLLLEEERLVMGFLVGPSKRRIAWPDLDEVQIADGEVVCKGKSGTELRAGKGCPDEELEQLRTKIQDAARRYADEGGL